MTDEERRREEIKKDVIKIAMHMGDFFENNTVRDDAILNALTLISIDVLNEMSKENKAISDRLSKEIAQTFLNYNYQFGNIQ